MARHVARMGSISRSVRLVCLSAARSPNRRRRRIYLPNLPLLPTVEDHLRSVALARAVHAPSPLLAQPTLVSARSSNVQLTTPTLPP